MSLKDLLFMRAGKAITLSRKIVAVAVCFILLTASAIAETIDPATFPSAAQLKQWQAATDTFDQGYRPTGSPAHEGYITWLTQKFSSISGVSVALEPYSFFKWTPKTWSLKMLNGTNPGTVSLANYIPLSGQTGPTGITKSMVYLPGLQTVVAQWAASQSNFMDTVDHQAAATATLQAQLKQLFDAGGVSGKIVVVDIPKIGIPLSFIIPQYYKNDPDNAFPDGGSISTSGILEDLIVTIPTIQLALVASGAKGMVGILDFPEQMARGSYYPFLGTQLGNLPGVFVNRTVGASLKTVIGNSGGSVNTKLVLDASFPDATSSKNIIAKLPGAAGKPEIIISTHSDGTNSIEDNAPAAMLAIATYFAKLPQDKRPCSFRFVVTGGHFIGSQGIKGYIWDHYVDLRFARAIIEVEHLGALEWAETSPGHMGLTGKIEPSLILTNFRFIPIAGTDAAQAEALLNRSIDFSKKFRSSLVIGPLVVGEGLWWHMPWLVVPALTSMPFPSIQFITAPSYLLVSRVPEVTSQFTDYNLMRNQTIALAQMAIDLAAWPLW